MYNADQCQYNVQPHAVRICICLDNPLNQCVLAIEYNKGYVQYTQWGVPLPCSWLFDWICEILRLSKPKRSNAFYMYAPTHFRSAIFSKE